MGDDPNRPVDGLTHTQHATGASASGAPLPATIGDYRILGKLGEGGMGVVYEAEQRNPHRKVALKVVRGGAFVDEHRIRMFKREEETLARLKHPNIGAIYEAGRTPDGWHFFAMELVRGETLDGYLKRGQTSGLSPEELRLRLKLLRKIAQAVHYAHLRGVIHRDLKPSNIIVADAAEDSRASASDAGVPEVKILDFGLARITDGDVAAATMTTEVGVIKGTLPYMSPEQARGNPAEIDVRADVYAMGVILYEMLAGSRPYDLEKSSLIDAVRVICEEPPRPLRQSWASSRRLDPDLETIVGKALEKEADRRYASAADLAEDIDRFLDSRPIVARPPSSVYQLRKFAARNRALVGGVVATFAVLLAGAVTSTVLGLQEAAQRRAAEQAKRNLERVVDFQTEMLTQVDPERMGRRLMAELRRRATSEGQADGPSVAQLAGFDAVLRRVNATDFALRVVDDEILARAAETIETKFADDPLTEATLRHKISSTYRSLGLPDKAESQAQRALEIRKAELGPEDPATLDARTEYAITQDEQSRYDVSEQIYLEVLEIRRRTQGPEHSRTLSAATNLAGLYDTIGRVDEAERLYIDALEVQRRTLGNEDPATLMTIMNLGGLYAMVERSDEAEALILEALEAQRKLGGDDSRDVLMLMNNLAVVYDDQGRMGDAERAYRETLEKQQRMLGEEHPETLHTMNNLAYLLQGQERFEEALPLLERTVEISERVFGLDHLHHAVVVHTLGELHLAMGELEAAEIQLRRALDVYRKIENHRYLGLVLYQIAGVTARRGERRRAIDLLEQAVATGWADAAWLEDPQFDGLRDEPAFLELEREVRTKAEG